MIKKSLFLIIAAASTFVVSHAEDQSKPVRISRGLEFLPDGELRSNIKKLCKDSQNRKDIQTIATFLHHTNYLHDMQDATISGMQSSKFSVPWPKKLSDMASATTFYGYQLQIRTQDKNPTNLTAFNRIINTFPEQLQPRIKTELSRAINNAETNQRQKSFDNPTHKDVTWRIN